VEHLHLQGCWINQTYIEAFIPQESENSEEHYWPVPSLRHLSLDGVEVKGDVIQRMIEARHAVEPKGMTRLRQLTIKYMLSIEEETQDWLRGNLDAVIIEDPVMKLRWSHPLRREYRGRIR